MVFRISTTIESSDIIYHDVYNWMETKHIHCFDERFFSNSLYDIFKNQFSRVETDYLSEKNALKYICFFGNNLNIVVKFVTNGDMYIDNNIVNLSMEDVDKISNINTIDTMISGRKFGKNIADSMTRKKEIQN